MSADTFNQDSTASVVRLLRQQLALVAVLAVVAGLALALPLGDWHIPKQHYLPLHTLLEFLSIFAAFLVFAVVWHTPKRQISASLVLLGVGLFLAGWLDFAHALSFEGMPDLVTPSSVHKGISFWLMARLVVALTFLVVCFYPGLQRPMPQSSVALWVGFTILNLFLVWAIVSLEQYLPITYVAGVGLTPFKINFERVIMAMQFVAAVRFYQLARLGNDASTPLLFGAAAVAALGEVFFTRYTVTNDLQNLLGHLLKIVSYTLIYRAVFVVSIRRPFERLAQQAQSLQSANSTMRMQALALDSSTNPIAVADLDGMIQWRNRASQQLRLALGGDLVNARCLFAPPLAPEPGVGERMRATVEAGNIWRNSVSLCSSQGVTLVLDQTVSPVRNETGGIEGYISTAEDVTARVNAQSRHKQVIDSVIDGFWICDRQGQLIEVNSAYANLSGYSIAELLRMQVAQLECLEDAAQIQAHMQTIMQSGHDQFETRHRHKDGHEIPVDISATYEPQTQQFFVFIRDRSDRVQATASRLALELQLQHSQKVQALGALTGGIAHDFNNILATILGYSNLALSRHIPDKNGKLARYMEEIITAGERARDLIARMLVFTRMQPSAPQGVISPAHVIREVISMVRPSIPSGIHLTHHIESDARIRIDAGELNQMLVNLVINARDSIGDHGKIDLRMFETVLNGATCACSQQLLFGPYLLIDVSDTGSGIKPENLPRLFDPFFTTKDIGKGTGLGLSMVQGILRRAKGSVLVTTELGRGSHFQLVFPLAEDSTVTPESTISELPRPTGVGQMIWIVDDVVSIARYWGDLLAGQGYLVRLFYQPTLVLEALEATEEPIDLVITDQTMPDMSGLELAAQIRQSRPNLPVILCTGSHDAISPHIPLPTGVRHVFEKPVAALAMLQVISELLESPTAK